MDKKKTTAKPPAPSATPDIGDVAVTEVLVATTGAIAAYVKI